MYPEKGDDPYHQGDEIKLKSIKEMQKMLNDITDKLYGLDVPESLVSDKYILELTNLIAMVVSDLQLSLNDITECIQNVYQIDASYEETINDPNKLSLFVQEMLDNGFPSKYISWNVYMVATKNMKGKDKGEDPEWRKTRLILFPSSPNDVVYKIALSGLGARKNRAEKNLWDKFKKNGKSDILAEVKAITNNNMVETMEKVQLINRTSSRYTGDILAMMDKLADLEKELEIPLNIHRNIEIGYKNDRAVCIKYGLGMRKDHNIKNQY